MAHTNEVRTKTPFFFFEAIPTEASTLTGQLREWQKESRKKKAKKNKKNHVFGHEDENDSHLWSHSTQNREKKE